jgi:hypothetical protein
MATKSGYTCTLCAKKYIQKYTYDRHVVCCEFFNKTVRHHEYEAETMETPPDINSLYNLVKELAFRVTKLEKENVQLKLQLSKRCKVNIIDWLNKLHTDKQPKQLFSQWVSDSVLPNVHSQLDCVYSNDLVSGIVSTWMFALSQLHSEAPIKAFETRTNTFYVYEPNDEGIPKWVVLTAVTFDIFLRRICKQFVVDFKTHWFDKNEAKITDDEHWANLYVDYYQKILGGSKITTEGIYQKVRQQLYATLKKSITQTVEVDFS